MKKLILLSIILIVGCEEPTEPEDCAGVSGGNSVLDDCGVCSGIEGYVASSCYDCAAVANGDAVEDICGVCNGNGFPEGACNCAGDTVTDCAGVCGGDSVLSGCDNACNSSAVEDCAGVCGGTAVLDDCGVCSGPGKNYICDGSGWHVCNETECPEPYTCSCDNWNQQNVCSTGPGDGYNACGSNKNAICIESYPNCSECYCE